MQLIIAIHFRETFSLCKYFNVHIFHRGKHHEVVYNIMYTVEQPDK